MQLNLPTMKETVISSKGTLKNNKITLRGEEWLTMSIMLTFFDKLADALLRNVAEKKSRKSEAKSRLCSPHYLDGL